MRNPPAWAAAVLRTLLTECDRDTIAGDLWEEFQDRGTGARRWYLRQVLSFLTPARLSQSFLTVALGWTLPFAAVTAWIFHRPQFTPVPAVAAFFICVSGAALQTSATRRRVVLGVAAAFTTALLIAALAGVALTLSRVPHPPLQTLAVLPCIAAFLGTVGGLFGSRFARPLDPLVTLFVPRHCNDTTT